MTRSTPPVSPSLDQSPTGTELAGELDAPTGGGAQEQAWDSVETYFECITTCSLDDGECVTNCVEELREHH